MDVEYVSGSFSSMEQMWQKRTVCIVGMGLIGGSYAHALRKAGVKKLIGVDLNQDVLAKAQNLGIIDVGLTCGEEVLREAELIICAVYPAAVLKFIAANVKYFREDVIVTDATGIKGDLLPQVDSLLKKQMDFVSGHPMAGREGSGLEQASAEIFLGSNYIVVARPQNQPANVEIIKSLACLIGCGKIVEVTPQEHDEIIAYTSNLPHAVAVALMNSQSMQANTKYFIAGSFRDATRVADINADLWAELFLFNRKNVVKELDKLQLELNKWREALVIEDVKQLKTMMQDAAQKRREMNQCKN